MNNPQNKKMFSGWNTVLLFTIKQGLNQKYAIITIVLVAILFAGSFGFNLLAAGKQVEKSNISQVKKVYLIDHSGLDAVNWNASKQLNREKFPKVVIEPTGADINALGKGLAKKEPTSVIARVSQAKDTFQIEVYLPYESRITKGDGENLAKMLKAILYEGMIRKSEIDSDKITYVVSGISTEYSVVGEEIKDEDSMMFKTMFPLIFMLGLYLMVIVYGQNMGQIVCIEKSSKLMETLLVTTKPYGLIFGKILATAGIAILQMAACIVALVAGLFVGDSYAKKTVYEGYDNPLLSMLKAMAVNETEKAFSIEAIILTILAVCLAFLFYCMLAGAIASFASKAEELGVVMMFYNLFLILGFSGSYFLPIMSGLEWIKVIVRIVPLSASFRLPGEILLGTIKGGAAIIYLLVLSAWTLLVAMFAGKIYRDQVFYNGKSFKDRIPWIKKKEEGDGDWKILLDESGRPLEQSQKIGYFFLAISPLALFFVIQILVSFVLTNVVTRWDFKGIDISTWEVKQLAEYYRGIEPTLNPLAMMICHLLIILTFGLWMYFVRKGMDKDQILHIKTLLKYKISVVLGISLVCGLGLLVLANGVVAVESYIIPSIVQDYMEMAKTAGMGTHPLAIIAAVCMAPIGEEFLCRGICLYFGKKAFGKFWYANLLQALMFGILHMNWVQGVYAFIIGLVLGILVERYDSLLPAMMVHFIINFSSSTWYSKVLGETEISLPLGVFMVLIPGAIVAAALYWGREKAC